MALSYIEVNPPSAIRACIIWLHGLGATSHDFAPIVQELQLPAALGVRFVFPQAPIIPVTINSGFEMPAWYDITAREIDAIVDKPGIMRSVEQVQALIESEVARGIPISNIVLAGFSQGAAMALTVGLNYDQTIGGIIALSGYLPLMADTLQNITEASRQTPIFIAHGTEDVMVPYALGKATYVNLRKANCNVSWHSYTMAHSVCAPEVADISSWLIQNIR